MSTATNTTLQRGLLLAFTLPTLVLGITHGPEGQIQAIYAKHAGLSLAALATAMLLTRIFDGITYPLIGYLSDRTYARTGSRRSWIIVGTVVSVIGVWFLMRPPQHVSVMYFGIWTAVLYVGWKLMEIPLQAWSYALSSDYAQRARVQAWRAIALMIGQILFFAIPFIAMKLGFSDSTELDFRSLGVAAVVCAIGLPLATLALITRVPKGREAPIEKRPNFGFKESLTAIRKNGPLLRLLAAFVPVTMLSGMSSGVAYFYMDGYLGLSKEYPAIMMVTFLMSFVGIPFWTAMSARYERHRVWAASLIFAGAACIAFAFTTPGPLALPMSFILYPSILFGLIGGVIVYTITGDIVDYGRLSTGEDQAGLYGAIFWFVQKSLLGVSSAAGVAVVAAFGFDATSTVQSASGVLGIKLVAAIIPAIGLLGGAALIWGYPLTRARTLEVQAELAARDRNAATVSN